MLALEFKVNLQQPVLHGLDFPVPTNSHLHIAAPSVATAAISVPYRSTLLISWAAFTLRECAIAQHRRQYRRCRRRSHPPVHTALAARGSGVPGPAHRGHTSHTPNLAEAFGYSVMSRAARRYSVGGRRASNCLGGSTHPTEKPNNLNELSKLNRTSLPDGSNLHHHSRTKLSFALITLEDHTARTGSPNSGSVTRRAA